MKVYREKTGNTLTDLDRYLISQFDPFLKASLGDVVTGQGFIHPSSDSCSRVITPYPYRFDEESRITVCFDQPVKSTTRPVYLELTVKKALDREALVAKSSKFKRGREVDLSDVSVYIVKSWDIVDLENVKGDLFPKYSGKVLDKSRRSLSYDYIRSVIMMDVQGYDSTSIHSEMTDALLDGTELEGEEDLLPIIAISSKQYSLNPSASRSGGFHVAMFGKKGLPAVTRRIIRLTEDPVLEHMNYWKTFSRKVIDYRGSIKDRKPSVSREFAVLLRPPKNKEHLFQAPFDYPLVIKNAPSVNNDTELGITFDPEFLNFITYMRFTEPDVPKTVITETGNIASRLIDYYVALGLPAGIRGRGTFFDQNYDGKPETAVRLAIAMARIQDKPVTLNQLKLAEDLMMTVLEGAAIEYETDPFSFYTEPGLERLIYKKAKDITDSYPEGIPVAVLLKQWRNSADVLNALDKLKRRGRVMELKKNHFVPL